MRLSRLVTGAVLAMGLAALAWGAQASGLELAEARLETVVQEEMVESVIEAVHRSTVSAQTAGRVLEILFDVDDFVPKGSVLLRIRDKEQRAALKAAEARLQEAQSEFTRIQDIFAKKLVAKSAFDKAEAALKAARAAHEQAEEQLERTVIRAPFSGIVVERHIEIGESANPGQPLMTGLSLERLRAVANVSQRHIETVRALAKARVILDSAEPQSVEGQAITISPYADPHTHTFKVRVDLPPGRHGVYPGSFAKVAFAVGERERLLIPAQAVVYRSEVSAAYVVDAQGSIAFRYLRLGNTLPDGRIEVLAGLSAGEQVALNPIEAGIRLKAQQAGEGS